MRTRNYLSRIAASIALAATTTAPIYAQVGTANLDVNNVKFRMYSDGSSYNGNLSSDPQVEVPRNSGLYTVFASSLWMGCVDNFGQLHMSGQTYKQTGTDFWSGPITTSGNSANPTGWTTVWKVSKSTINYHTSNYTNPGYVPPGEITDWPGNGPAGFAPVLAPFMDVNGNSIYEPMQGDYPFIMGDQELYFIFNDKYTTHSETGGMSMGAEIHGQAFAFNDPNDTALSNTVFVRYTIVNKNANLDWNDFYFGLWADFDIGYYFDDYVGTDSTLDMFYAYNGDAVDGPSSSSNYGANPPVEAIVLLSHPMSHVMYYNNDFTATGNPVTADDYYGYFRSMWKDSLHTTYGGNGYGSSASPTDYFYTGDPVAGTGWTEGNAGNTPGDRRMLGTAGPISVPRNSVVTFDVAYVYSRSNSAYPASITKMRSDVAHIHTYYNNNIAAVGVKDVKNEVKNIGIYPNPAGDHATLHFDNADHEAYTLRLFDATGKTVKEEPNITGTQADVDCSDMPKGIYFVVVQGSQKVFTGKLVVE